MAIKLHLNLIQEHPPLGQPVLPELRGTGPNSRGEIEQFVRDCLNFLRDPNCNQLPTLSLQKRVFQYLGERRLDLSLDLLLPIIEEFIRKGVNFKEIVPEIDRGIPCIDFSCQQIAFLLFKALAKEQHHNYLIAWRLFERIGQNMTLLECLSIGYLEQAIRLIQATRPNPNEGNGPFCLMHSVFHDIASGFYEDIAVLHLLPDLIKALLEIRGDPNFRFNKIEIRGCGTYKNASCLHVAYLCWRLLKEKGGKLPAKWMKQVFFHLLRDPRIDARARFSEVLLERDGGHFSTDLYHGDYIQEGTLAHISLVEGDFSTCKKVLDIAPDLVASPCFTTFGSWMLEKAFNQGGDFTFLIDPEGHHFLQSPVQKRTIEAVRDSTVTGQLARIHFWNGETEEGKSPKSFEVIRYGGVSLCHIAARRMDLMASTFLTTVGGNHGLNDTEHRSAIDYAKLFIEDNLGIVTAEMLSASKKVFKALRKATPLPMTVPRMFYILHREGYDLIYNAGSKCPIVREVLFEQALAHNIEAQKHGGYRQDPDIPRINRAAVQDFKYPGLVLGHARPRADARMTDQALFDVGFLTNILAMDGVLNNGMWKRLEEWVRSLTQTNICLHVYTGGIFTSPDDAKGAKIVTYRVIGQGEVHVPTHLFKVIFIFNYQPLGWQSIAFRIPNIPLPYHTDLNPYIVPVQRIQELTGVDFNQFYSRPH